MCAWLRPPARATSICALQNLRFLCVGGGAGCPAARRPHQQPGGGSRKSNQRRLTGAIALRTLGGTRRVDVCVAAPAGARDFDLFVGEILFMHLSFIHATVARIIANIILLFYDFIILHT